MINKRNASSNSEMRDKCLADLERFFIDGTWWAGSYGDQFKNKPKPEFNKVWKAINRIVGDINDMELNALIVSNSSDATDEDAELLQKRWRNDYNASEGAEASEIATMEAVIGGFGCTKLVSRYEDEEDPQEDEQYLCAEIIHSACTSVYFDAGSIRKDKSDSRWGWQLIRVNREKIEDEYGVDVVSFDNQAYSLSSTSIQDTNRDIYLAHYWELIDRKLTTYDFSAMVDLQITTGDGIKDQLGNKYTRDDLKMIRDDYELSMGEQAPMTKRTVKCVEYALLDGEKMLTKPEKTPFKRIPLIPRYGYHAVINGYEYFCGEVRKKLDTEMFQNVFGSTMMEIMAASQVSKPEYTPEQIARHASQRARADIDNVPFVMSDPIMGADGKTPVHFGPIGMTQPPQMGTGLQAAGMFLEQNTQEQNGSGQSTVPANSSAQAVQMVNDRQDDCYLPMVKNTCHSIKAMCETWIPAAQKLYFSNQRKIRVEEQDGNYSQINTLEMKELEDGRYGPYGNSARGRYTVQVKQDQSYKDRKQAEFDQNINLLQMAGTESEMGKMALLNAILNTTGEGTYFSRKIARYKQIDVLLSMSIDPEPANPEEEQYIQQKMQQMQQAAQNPQQDPNTVAAQAMMLEAQSKQAKGQVDIYNAETKRMDTNIKGQDAQANVMLKEQDLQLRAWEKRQSNNSIMNG